VAITGGAGDIGSAIAADLGARGARVSLLDRTPLAEVTGRLEGLGLGPAHYHQVDVRQGAEVAAALGAIRPLDVVFANAGVGESAPFLEIGAEQWRLHVDTNLTGAFNTAQAAARLMVERGTGGRIVFTGSWIQEVPWPEVAAYSASKAGVRMLARSMALELARHRILVNVLAPGIVNAGTARRQLENEPQYARRAARAIPLGQLQSVEQVARAAAFLCTSGADYMTGTTLLVDGGASILGVG
jgi:NAD(P)-dependent dehydrogenase (short-subunit alcohol dehydrogenase family)